MGYKSGTLFWEALVSEMRPVDYSKTFCWLSVYFSERRGAFHSP